MILLQVPPHRRDLVAGLITSAVPRCENRRRFYERARSIGFLAAAEELPDGEWKEDLIAEIKDVIEEIRDDCVRRG